MNPTLKKLIYLLAFIEGGAVMCVELCSAKILSPFFGTTIFVWAAVLGITLLALMSGYYLGGYISSKNQKRQTLFWLMLLAGVLVTSIPIISTTLLPFTIRLNILPGTIISLLSFLFLPLLLFGSISPFVIHLLTKNAKESGKNSGTVYAISTLGGIITTFIVGFYTLPEFGISITLYAYGILVILMAILLFIVSKTFPFSVVTVLLLGGGVFFNFQYKTSKDSIIYQSEGIMGDIKVVDRTFRIGGHPEEFRELMVNNISQTIMNKKNPNQSYWDYVNTVVREIETYANGNETLLLGLGGGTLYKQLEAHNFKTDVVEIDKRIAAIAKKYFHIDEEIPVIIDDGRHYINTTKKKYNVIIYDMYHSETPPVHLMTKEAFSEIKERLSPNGILLINFYGFIKGNKGKGARSIYKTLIHEKYHVEMIATPGEEKSRNLIFIAGKEELIPKKDIDHISINQKSIPLDNAFVLCDDKPILEHLYLEAALSWRKNYNEINAKKFLTYF